MIKDVQKHTINEIFGKEGNDEQLYIIPPYQREYAWGQKHWSAFIDDIESFDGEHFLGSIICIDGDIDYLRNQEIYKNLPLDANQKMSCNEVIDGQQRLTTTSILSLAIYNKMTALLKSEELYEVLDEEEVDDYKSEVREIRQLICIKISGGERKTDIDRLFPSLQNSNLADYQALINEVIKSKEETKPKNYGNRKIKKAYDFFGTRLDDLCKDKTGKDAVKNLLAFYKKLSHCFIVKITVDSASSALMLFDSLNNRGTPLTPIDLIKTKAIFKRGENNTTLNEANDEWQKIINNIPRYENQVRYLRHYYQAFMHNPKVKIDNITKITKANLIDVYSKIIGSDDRFAVVYDDLLKKSEIYGAMTNPKALDNETAPLYRYKDKLSDLSELGVAQGHMLLLFLLDKWKEQDYSQLLDYLENWFLVRHLTNYPATNRLDRIFGELISTIKDNKNYNFDDIKQFLDGYRTTNKRIFEILTQEPLYENNAQALRYLLIKLEKSKSTKETKKDLWETKNGKPVWSLEHIYPQKAKQKIEALEEYKDKLGNITLTAYNSNLSNHSYADKLVLSKKDSCGNDVAVGLASGNVAINNYIKQKYESGDQEWQAEDVEKRGHLLAKDFLALIKSQGF